MPTFAAAFSREQLIAAVRVADFYKGLAGTGGGSVSYVNAVTGRSLAAQDSTGFTPDQATLGANSIDIQGSRTTALGSAVTARGTDTIALGTRTGQIAASQKAVLIGSDVRDNSAGAVDGSVMIGRAVSRNGAGAGFTNAGLDVAIGTNISVVGSTGRGVYLGDAVSVSYSGGAINSALFGGIIIGSGSSITTSTTGLSSEGVCSIGNGNALNRVLDAQVFGLGNTVGDGTAQIDGSVLIGLYSTLNRSNTTRIANTSAGNQAQIDVIGGGDINTSLVELGGDRDAGGANTRHRFAIADGGPQAVTITSAIAVVSPDNCTTIYVRGTFAGAGTVRFPGSPIFGQEVIFSVESSSLTSLTLQAPAGQSIIGPATMPNAQGSFSRWRYGGIQSAPDTAWRRVG